jgi:uncharacterized membrane protein YdbT with pleckstrin-like domain
MQLKLKTGLTAIFILLANFLFAQTTETEMADKFRADGKIYVVIAVICILFAVLFSYLIRIDGKVRKMEGKK